MPLPASSPSAVPARDSRRLPVRLLLMSLAAALALPGLVFSAVLLGRFAGSERARYAAEAQADAKRAADALDRELAGLQAALQALATSPALAQGDLHAFHEQARAVAASMGQNFVLSDPQGQQLVNTRRPFGAVLPRYADPESYRRTLETRRPTVSNLFTGSVVRQHIVTVNIPVSNGGEVAYVLTLSTSPELFSDVLQAHRLPGAWVAAAIDGRGVILGRGRDHDRYVGRLATQDLRDRAVGEHGTWIGSTADGTPVLGAYARLRLADWRVAIGVPLSTIEAPLRGALLALSAMGGVLLAACCALAWWIARGIARPLQALAEAGARLGRGGAVAPVRSRVAEVAAVSDALAAASSDLRARAAALAEERARLAAVIEALPVGVMIADAASGRVVAGNREVERILGHPAARVSAGDAPGWIASHADGRRVEVGEFPLVRALRGEAQPELEFRYRRPDESQVWLYVAAAPLRDAQATLTGAVVGVLDIEALVRAREEKARFTEVLEPQVAERTEALEAANRRLTQEMVTRAEVEEQLRQAQKMEAVGQLTGGIAHDFNNLLTVVIGSLDLLRRRVRDERALLLAGNAMEGAQRAATLTSQLLAFSRQQSLSPKALDVNRLVAGMSDLLRRTLGEQVRLETVLAGGLWQVRADQNQLENALLNLAVNARDAMTEQGGGGRLTIETANAYLDESYAQAEREVAPGRYVMLAVTDTGGGMAPEVAARAFEPFYTTKPFGRGTGLGLSQVHGFVKQSGGHVKIHSEPGHGTTVKIYPPRSTARPEGERATQPPIRAGAGGKPGELLLVVEDEEGVRRFSAEALRDLGYDVLEAQDGAHGLRLLDAHPGVKLLFTDVVMPDMNGRRLAEEARARRPGLRVLFTTGYTRNAIVHNGRLDPGVDLLPKPFTLQALAAKVRDVLDRPPAEDT